jgi:predicted MPP superfamily phosphohydrolase
VAEIRALAPDLILSTGDFVDSSVRNVAPLADAWATLSPPLGKYAILGNHEFYTGVADAVALHQEAGFQLLRASGVNVNEALSLYGVDDPAGQYLGLADFTSEAQLPLHAPRARFTILLKHQPRINPFSIGRFDLQLSGHTHGGQVFPFHLVARLIYPFTTGHFDIGQHSHLYVSRGTGTWGPPLRFLAPPEITVITLSPPP